jgi:hypothetical protein
MGPHRFNIIAGAVVKVVSVEINDVKHISRLCYQIKNRKTILTTFI